MSKARLLIALVLLLLTASSSRRSLWIDRFLQGRFTFPKTPETKLVLASEEGILVFRVTPDASMPIERVQLL